mmetsp:Transcript_14179/g.29410  ORF Transcript_14179/g.29410 Transcript_14179/m.29410 type:complete len:317 (-) Transcript_14179:83-1033(-)
MRALAAEGVESTPSKLHKYTVMPNHTLPADMEKQDPDSPGKLHAGRALSEDKLRLFEVTSAELRKPGAWCDPASYAAQGGGSAGWRLTALLALLSAILAFAALFHQRSSHHITTSTGGELLQRLEAFERDASAERDARAGMERRQQVELQRLKEVVSARSKENDRLRSEIAKMHDSLNKHIAQDSGTAHQDQSELALEVQALRKDLDSEKDALATESRERKKFQGELKQSEKVPEDNLPCQDAVIGEKCFKNVVWAKTEGIRIHPGWYDDLTQDSTFKEFQMALHKNGLYGCRKPCKEKGKASEMHHDGDDFNLLT